MAHLLLSTLHEGVLPTERRKWVVSDCHQYLLWERLHGLMPRAQFQRLAPRVHGELNVGCFCADVLMVIHPR